MTAACNSLACLTSPSSCTWNVGNLLYTTKPGYNDLQVGDTFYTTASLTTVATTLNGYRILFTTPSYSLVNFVNGVLDTFVNCTTPTPTPTNTQTPTSTPTNTPSETPTNTPTPSVTPSPVTGYSFNLVALPYNFPTSGNSIMNGAGGATSGSTDPNVLATGGRGFYFNSIDSGSVDRTNYYSAFTGQSVTITLSQTGSTAIYSGDTGSFKQWEQSPMGSGFVFGANINVPGPSQPPGNALLIQSAPTPWTIGLPVYVSLQLSP